MVRISENQQFSDFLSFSREIPVPFSTVSKFSEVEVERSESALGKLVLNKVLYDSLPFYIAFFTKKVPLPYTFYWQIVRTLSHTSFRTLHPF